MKIKFNYLFYLLIIFFIIFLIKKTLFGKHIKKHYKHNNYTNYDTPVDMIRAESKNNVKTPFFFQNNMNDKNEYKYDSYEPRFIAPRYYDTQFLTDKQPVYVRTHGYYPMKNSKKNRKYKAYNKRDKAYNYDSSSSDSSDNEM